MDKELSKKVEDRKLDLSELRPEYRKALKETFEENDSLFRRLAKL